MSRIVAKNVADTIRMLSLNSPDGLNLLNSQFFHELHTQFLRVSKDSAVRVVIMNATNAALFCAGLDMKKGLSEDMLDKKSKSEAQDNLNLLNMIDVAQQAVSMLEMCRVPVIAAVHGKCLGGGVDLITAADMRICTKDAVFSVMETRVGITADLGTLQRISRIVGEGRAREFAFTGREIGSDEALRCGLVNAVYKDQSEMNTAAEQLAQQIACNSPLAVQGTKKILNALHQDTTAKSLELVRMWNTMTLRSNDLREAMAAFQEKRPPVFTEHIPLPPDRMECAPAPRM